MAYVPHIFLTFFLFVVAEGAQLGGNISLGSSLFASSQPTSWPSPSGRFAFGFYPAGDGFAVGIWLTSKPNITVVWTANRDDPPLSFNSTVELTDNGSLLLRNSLGHEKHIVHLPSPAISASMLDSGNFVIYDQRSQVIWESFAYPTDTILGGQNLASNANLFSSVSALDHSTGRFFVCMQKDGTLGAYPVSSSQTDGGCYWATGLYNGEVVVLNLNLAGDLCLLGRGAPNCLHNRNGSSNPVKNEIVIYRATLDPDGNFRLYAHSFNINGSSTPMIEWAALQNVCQGINGSCGVNSYCSSTGTVGDCSCFPGFLYFNQSRRFRGCYQNLIDEEGCRGRGSNISYNITPVDHIELGQNSYSVRTLNRDDCGRSCLEDCICWATLYVNGTCQKYRLPLSYGLLNMNTSSMAFIKTSFSTSQVEQVNPPILKNRNVVVQGKRRLVLILAGSLGFLAFVCTIIAICSFVFYRSRTHMYQNLSENARSLGFDGEFALQSFSFDELVKATNGFKEVLGRNSFGAVYKGFICEGRKAIAVKRVERVLEGERGFRAEMKAIGQTHHRNLVRLLGFCIDGAKKLLIYEFMSNGSLEDLLFKADKRPSWEDRLRIALDVARGILYLHEECEACIIHCNIKPQNILFDDAWTAKIADFGLAKLLMRNQSGTLTSIRGTRGYLAPEWQKNKNTLISKKVDIYSFGVILLEIVCCRSNMEVNVSEADEILLSSWVYKCFKARELRRLVNGDEEDINMNILERIVMVGLLCIQDDPEKRPSMKNVILMLEGTTDIPVPSSPTQPPPHAC